MLSKNIDLEKVSSSIGQVIMNSFPKYQNDQLNGQIIVPNKLGQELLTLQVVWQIEWPFGLRGTGKFKIKLIQMLILSQLLEQLDLCSVKFGNGFKAQKPTEIQLQDMDAVYKVLISLLIQEKIKIEALLFILRIGLKKM